VRRSIWGGDCEIGQAGVPVEIVDKTTMRLRGAKKLVGADVTTEEYPGFATDMQAQFMALATQAEGTSVIQRKFLRIAFCMRVK